MTARSSRNFRHGLMALVCLLLMLAPLAVFGQSCALCYTQAAASTHRFIQALRSGILVLMVPPMLMCVGFTWMAYSRRNTFYSSHEQ